MRYITNCAISIKGDRIEKGTEVELSADDLKQYDAADFTSVSDPVEEPPPAPEPPIEEMTLSELRRKAETLGLSASGSKADIQERITLHLATPADAKPEEGGEEDIS